MLLAVTPGSLVQLAAACEAVASRGFINYYGLQRFGTAGVPTHKVGAALLKGQYKAAVDLIMSGCSSDQGGEGGGDGGEGGGGGGRQDQRREVVEGRAAWVEKRDPQVRFDGCCDTTVTSCDTVVVCDVMPWLCIVRPIMHCGIWPAAPLGCVCKG